MGKGGHGHGGHSGGFGHGGFGHGAIGHAGFGHHHHHSGGRGGGGMSIGINETLFDSISISNIGPMALNGIYSLSGNQINVMTHLENYEQFLQQNLNLNPQPVTQANLTIIGSKTATTNTCCAISTLISGMCCIFPLCFMCCGWWKKIVNAKYEINTETYRSLSRILNNPMSPVTNLNLTIVDNAFNFEKARILYQMLSTSRLTGFTFTNQALACNYNASEADDFLANMAPLRSLPFPCVCTWDDLILV